MSDKKVTSDTQITPADVASVLDKIAGVQADHQVQGVKDQQFGVAHLKFRCPKCTLVSAIGGPGKIICPKCGQCTIEVLAP